MTMQNGSVSSNFEKGLKASTGLYRKNAFDMGASLPAMETVSTEDVGIDITDCRSVGDASPIKNEYRDTTESSSSFSDTAHGADDSESSDPDVLSQLHGHDTHTSINDGCAPVFRVRKKKLTDHWRNFAHPLLWRCRWIELKLRETQSQAAEYVRVLAEHNRIKQLESEKFLREGNCMKSFPFYENRRNRIMRRKNRKRVEDTTDVASYMSRHNFFSYYDMKRSPANGALMANECVQIDKTPKADIELPVDDAIHDFIDGDKSLELVLNKISEAQSWVDKLRDVIERVLIKNAQEVPSTDDLGFLMPCNSPISSPPCHAASPGEKVTRLVGPTDDVPWMPDDSSMQDVVSPRGVAWSHESAVLLSDLTGDAQHTLFDGSLKEEIFEVDAKEELQSLEERKKEDSTPCPGVAGEAHRHPGGELAWKVCFIPKTCCRKRKRAARKAASWWTRKSSKSETPLVNFL